MQVRAAMEKEVIEKKFEKGLASFEPQQLGAYSGTGHTPIAVLAPKTAQEVEEIVRWAGEVGCPLVPVSSAGPHYKGGSSPAVEKAVMLDLGGLKNIISADRRQRMAVVEPGVTYEELLPFLAQRDLTVSMPLAPKAGKSVAASLLELEPRLNCIRQWNYVEPLRCLDVVWGDGNRMRTGDAFGGDADPRRQQEQEKWQLDAPGPMMVDYYRLMTGAMGTMGVAVWASVRCEILPKRHELYFAASDTMGKVIDFAYHVIYPRFSDELLVVNKAVFSALSATQDLNVTEAAGEWIALTGIAGRDCAVDLRVDGQHQDIADIARKAGLTLEDSMGTIQGEEMLEIITNPCPEGRYWRDLMGEGWESAFFITTMDRTEDFYTAAVELAEELDYRGEDLGVYIQPLHQGVCCHCEFLIPYQTEQAEKARAFKDRLSRLLSERGAYFSRPYGSWMDLQLGKDNVTQEMVYAVKDIFDPKGIMNPGKLGER